MSGKGAGRSQRVPWRPKEGKMPVRETASWVALQLALARGDMQGVRQALRGLDEAGQAVLAQRLGAQQTELVVRAARRSRDTARSASGGRVVVIHGIMGARLDVVEPDGDSDRVWVNVWRLFDGRIADLELLDGVRPRDPRKQVRVAGLLPEYLPLMAELDGRWKVQPFAFDWRLDIDDSAARLAETIRAFAKGEPCHIIAHSMGGLVARRMITLFPDVWASMRDPEGKGRGGRLVQLGTPNRGSLAIPMMLTGQEPTVRKLAMLDRKHDLDDLLAILGTFPGSYQMLPAPGSGFDDRDRLYRKETWGTAPANGDLLKRASSFHESLVKVVDPERVVYVAGYDQDTPYRLRIAKPGRFEYQWTRQGDGRVPHDLGLLDGVRTLWVDEVHGDLPRNVSVLAGVHDLLLTGNTLDLLQSLPAARGMAPKGWVRSLPEHASEADLRALNRGLDGVRSRNAREPDAGETERIEALVVRGFVGDAVSDAATTAGETRRRAPRVPTKPLELPVEVVCGDIRKVAGDVYAVGHYVGVLPQCAEAALDRVVSPKNAPEEDRVLNSFTRRGVLRGELGAVDLFPWADGSGRQVAVAGMGHPGSFGRAELRRLGQSLTAALTALPRVRTVCAVLIGSGVGNLRVREAVDGLLVGAADALRRERKGGSLGRLKIVELDLVKAHEIQAELKRLADDKSFAQVLKLKLSRRVTVHPSARLCQGFSLSLALAGLATGASAKAGSSQRRAVDAFLRSLPGGAKARREVLRNLGRVVPAGTRAEDLAACLEVVVHDPCAGAAPEGRVVPTRFSCVRDGDMLRVAALSDTAVVPQRPLRFDLALFDELAASATDPPADRAADLGALIGRLLIPHEFAPYLHRAAALVGELDRYTARLVWELITLGEPQDGAPEALALSVPFARQLLTAYSPAPAPPQSGRAAFRALVIGDPGDPREGHDLPGARREAIEVARFLKEQAIEVEARIGAPSSRRTEQRSDFAPAGRLEVLELLLSGRFDLVHYCGHGYYDPQHPEKVGWVFEGGLLTAREIERIEQAPRLIVANACLSGRISERVAGGGTPWRGRDDSGLLPTLADEFFKRGVRDYVGTAWEVSDEGAILFAKTLYGRLLSDGPDSTLGDAMLAARKALYGRRDAYDTLWAAYQHYGDPATRLWRGSRGY